MDTSTFMDGVTGALPTDSSAISSTLDSLLATATSSSSVSMDAAASSSALQDMLASASSVLASASAASSSAADFIATATGGASSAKATEHPASYKIIGIVLAVASGLFIGSSFVFKKKGLLSMQSKPGFVAGEGHAYLKSPMWWTGMILMIIGEICNFAAYAFTEAMLVTPLGALSVVICAILSSIFLKERLTFFGKIGCGLCILGATIIALNGPSTQTESTIKAFQKLFLAPGFLAFGSIVIVVSAGLVFFVAPKYGKKNMFVYILVCSLIGGLSVVCTSGLGSSILTSINGNNQFKNWFIYFLMVFVVCTLLIEINYLNKALELFNTAIVTSTYYVIFTSCTLLTDIILNKGFHAPVPDIITVIFGFLTICAGITLLQMSKIDPKDLSEKVKLDRRTTMLLSAANMAERKHERQNDGSGDESDVEANEKRRNIDLEDPGIDSIRGFVGLAGSVHRAISARKSIASRRKSRLSHTGTSGHTDDVEVDENGMIVNGRWKNRRSRHGANNNNRQNLHDGIVRHQLYDAPMPLDAAERISHFSGNDNPISPTSDRHTTIGFEEDVIEHRYPAQGHSGDVVHQQHYPPPYIPSPTNNRTRSTTEPSVDLLGSSYPSTARPQPAIRANSGYNSNTFPSRSSTSSSKASSSLVSSTSTATGGSLQRAGTRSLSQMITDHFAATTPHLQVDLPGNDSDVDEHGRQRTRSTSNKSRSPTGARGFFSSLAGHASQRDQDSMGEERLGLVHAGAEMGSRRDLSGDSSRTPTLPNDNSRQSSSGRSSRAESEDDEYEYDMTEIHDKPTRRL